MMWPSARFCLRFLPHRVHEQLYMSSASSFDASAGTGFASRIEKDAIGLPDGVSRSPLKAARHSCPYLHSTKTAVPHAALAASGSAEQGRWKARRILVSRQRHGPPGKPAARQLPRRGGITVHVPSQIPHKLHKHPGSTPTRVDPNPQRKQGLPRRCLSAAAPLRETLPGVPRTFQARCRVGCRIRRHPA